MTTQPLTDRLKELPADWQADLQRLNLPEVVKKLAADYKLSREQEEQLEAETVLVAIGLELRTDLTANLTAALHSDSAAIISIKDRLERDVFNPLAKHLDQAEKEIKAAEAEEREKYKHLPLELQKVILDARTEEILAALSDKYQLHIDQAGALYDVTDQVLMGKIKSRDFVAELVRTSSMSTDLASKIAADLNQQLFQPVQNTLRTLESQPPTVFEAKLKGLWSGNQNQSSNEILIKPQPATTATTPTKVADPYLEPLE